MAKLHRSSVFLAVLAWLALPGSLAQAAPGSQWRPMGPDAVLRDAPVDTAAVVAHLDRETRLLELERRVAWLRVAVIGVAGQEGWIRERALLPVPATSTSSSGEPSAGAPTPAANSRHQQFRLEVDGTPALAFKAECLVAELVDGKSKQRFVAFSGLVPKQADFEVEAVSCEVRKGDARGRLTVRLYQDGEIVAAHSTAAAFNYIRVRSDGPWGEARATRGGVAVLGPPRRQDPARRGLRPQGTIVPPLSP